MKKIYLTMCLTALTLAAAAQTSLDKPQVQPATAITASAFTANWERVDSAEAYCVYVYVKNKVTTTGETVICDEDFNGITAGSIANPIGGEDLYVDLSEYGYCDTYGWSANAYPTFAAGKVSGQVYSPYLDLRGDSGRYKIIITTLCTDGDTIRVESNGADGKEIRQYRTHVENGGNGYSTDTLEFDNGNKDLFFSIINMTAEPGQYDWVDEVKVTQNLKAGDVVNTLIASNEAVMAWDDDLNDSVTSVRFASMPYKGNATVVYYDLYAAAHVWTTVDGRSTYKSIYSPYSDLVKVDLSARTSEIVDDNIADRINRVMSEEGREMNQNAYNLAGQRVGNDYHGIVIIKGKKVKR